MGGNDRFYFEKSICMMYTFFFFLIGKHENVDHYSHLNIRSQYRASNNQRRAGAYVGGHLWDCINKINIAMTRVAGIVGGIKICKVNIVSAVLKV